jgi:hypothetical protein
MMIDWRKCRSKISLFFDISIFYFVYIFRFFTLPSDDLLYLSRQKRNKRQRTQGKQKRRKETKMALQPQPTTTQVLTADLYKTELCRAWEKHGSCSFGNKCNYAHGTKELRDRVRVTTFHIQPCVDSVTQKGQCGYGKRCNYAHPGDMMRAPCNRPYFDWEYLKCITLVFPHVSYPFGIFV